MTMKPRRDRFLLFGKPQIQEAEIREMEDTLRSGWIGTGPKAQRFEADFCAYTGARHAIALNSCTAGLHVAMVAHGMSAGDEVITTPLTFAATANSILHAGASPRFIDVDPATTCIDPEGIRRYLETCGRDPKTGVPFNRSSLKSVRAILPVHFAGRPCEMDAIQELASEYNLYVIEDAAHAIETVYKGRKIGASSDATCFSFYVTKNVVTGEGGMVTTDDDEIARRIRVLALHGMSQDAWKRFSDDGFKHYTIQTPGFKYNMTDMQASLGIHQLKRIGENAVIRQRIWDAYDAAFADLPLETPPPAAPDTVHARHLYTVHLELERLTTTRDHVQQMLHQMNIGTGIHYVSLHLHDYYRASYGFRPDDFPAARWISERTLSLPLSPSMNEQDADDVIHAVRTVLASVTK